MKAQHTPGPWKISKSPAGKTGTSMFIWRNDPGENEGNTGYAKICQHVHSEADASLIAAAPALLDALEGLIKNFPGDPIIELFDAQRIVDKAKGLITDQKGDK